MERQLSDLFEKIAPTINTLPIIHTCEAIDLEKILKDGQLTTANCKVLNQKYLYTFYGIPSYRKHHDKATANQAYFPVCFILDYEQSPDMKRLLPTDSGAFETRKEVKKDHFHNRIQLENLELKPHLDEAKKLIEFIYHSNQNYIEQKPQLTQDKVSQVNQAAYGYLSLINDKSATNYDNRVATIECIFDINIELTQFNFKHIIAPGTFLSDPAIGDLIENKYKINTPRAYQTMKGKVDEGVGAVFNYYMDYLNEQGML